MFPLVISTAHHQNVVQPGQAWGRGTFSQNHMKTKQQ